jgi:hypothetical protein
MSARKTEKMLLRLSAADLQRLYVEEGKGCPEIGRIADRDAKTVYGWLREAGIQTRPRGRNVSVQFKAGQPSAFRGRRHSTESRAKIGAATEARESNGFMRDGVHYLKTAAPDENPNWKGGCTPERQTFYRSPEWKLACRIVWNRADACCERCGADYRSADRRVERFHVHHIISFAVKAFRAAPSNLALLCTACHRFVHSKANANREFLPAVEIRLSREAAA